MTRSPFSKGEKVASRNGSGRQARSASRALREGQQSFGCPEIVSGESRDPRKLMADPPEVIGQSQIAAHDMLEESDGLCLHELGDHVAEHCADSIEALVRLADVGEAHFVEEDLLDDENGDRLTELAPRLHDAQAEGDDFRGEQEVDDVAVVVLLDEGANDAERGEAQVLEGPCLARRVEERVQEERDVRLEEEGARVVVRGDALQQGESVAHAVGCAGCQGSGREERVHRDDLLEQGRHDA